MPNRLPDGVSECLSIWQKDTKRMPDGLSIYVYLYIIIYIYMPERMPNRMSEVYMSGRIPDIMSEYIMSEYVSDRISVGEDHSTKELV